jgi:hypothetical protein
MNTQPMIIIDRRQRPRYGPIAEIENLTYSVLRRYGITGPTEQHSPTSMENAGN